MRKLYMFIICVVVFLAIYGAVPPVNSAINGALAAAGGESWAGLSAFGASIAANPIYQQTHVLIWFIGGIVFTVALIKLRKRRQEKKQATQQAPVYQDQLSTPQLYPPASVQSPAPVAKVAPAPIQEQPKEEEAKAQ